MSIYSPRANLDWLSNPYVQTENSSDWVSYQVQVKSVGTQVALANKSTSSVEITWPIPSESDELTIKDSDGNYTRAQVGQIVVGDIYDQPTPTLTYLSERTYPNAVDDVIRYTRFGTGILSMDGTRLLTNSYVGFLQEWIMTTPFDVTTLEKGTAYTGPGYGNRQIAFAFTQDGKRLYTGYSGVNYSIAQWDLARPFDLSSRTNGVYKTLGTSSGIATGTVYMSISPDGFNLYVSSNNGTSYSPVKFTMTTAFDINTISTTGIQTNYNLFVNVVPYKNYPFPSGDGLSWMTASRQQNSSYASNMYIYRGSVPFDVTTVNWATPVRTISFSSGNYVGDWTTTGGGGADIPMMCPTPDFSKVLFFTNGTQWSNYTTVAKIMDISTYGVFGTPYVTDITSHNLTSAPVAAWKTPPKLKICTESSADRLNMYKYQLEHVAAEATTTTAVVGHLGTGVIQQGDTVILDDTTEVTVTNVVEESQGLPALYPGFQDDYISYSGKSFSADVFTPNRSTSSTYQNFGCIQFSADGRWLFVLGDGGDEVRQIASYNLSVPWDVSTASRAPYATLEGDRNWYLANVTNNLYYFPAYNSSPILRAFSIKPDGTRMIVLFASMTATTGVYTHLGQYELSTPWDLSTASLTVTTPLPNTSTTQRQGMVMNRSGTQILVTGEHDSDTTGAMEVSLGSPWDISSVTAGAWQFDVSISGSTYGPRGINHGGHIDASGNLLFTCGYCSIGLATYNQGIGLIKLMNNDDIFYGSKFNSPASDGSAAFDQLIHTYTRRYGLGSPGRATGYVNTGSTVMAITSSEDGTKLYIMYNDASIRQYNVRMQTLNKYTITFAAQASAPTTVHLPDRSVEVSLNNITENALDSTKLDYSSDLISKTTRAVQFKMENSSSDSTIGNVNISLYG